MTITDRETKSVPGLDGVHVRTLNGREYRKFQADVRKLEGLPEEERNVTAVYLMVHASACEASGRRLFDGDEIAAAEEISIIKAKAIYQAAVELNGLAEKKTD